MELTQELVKSLFDYHQDGYLIWKIKPRANVNIGDRAGHLAKYRNEYRWRVTIHRKRYMISCLIYFLHTGELPERVDHRDRNSLNDKIKNLRAASRFENARNRSSVKNSSSKYLGVSIRKNGKWAAHIRIAGVLKFLGYYFIEEEAAEAYNEAAKIYHKEFANLNVISIP